MNLLALREQTREQHESVEAMLPFAGAGLTRERYAQTLQWFYRVVEGWETWAGQHAPAPLAAMVQERRRAPLMLRDLEFLGVAPLSAESSALRALRERLSGSDADAAAEFEARFLGAMYVMEGSTLGGQYIARHVEQVLGLEAGQGDAYFRGYGEETGAMWNAFRQVLSAIPEEHASQVIAAAKSTFAYVEEAMRDCPAVLETPHAVL